MNVCNTGLNKMHAFVTLATADIRSRMWSFYWLARMVNAKLMVELGVRQGDSTRALLCAAEDLDATLVSYDTENDDHVIMDPVLREHWKFFVDDSARAGVRWSHGPVDLVFIDTDHTRETTKKEIAAWSPHVRIGGCMVFHDYWLTDAPRDGVKPAVDAFVDANYPAWELETWDRGPDGDTGGCVIWRRK